MPAKDERMQCEKRSRWRWVVDRQTQKKKREIVRACSACFCLCTTKFASPNRRGHDEDDPPPPLTPHPPPSRLTLPIFIHHGPSQYLKIKTGLVYYYHASPKNWLASVKHKKIHKKTPKLHQRVKDTRRKLSRKQLIPGRSLSRLLLPLEPSTPPSTLPLSVQRCSKITVSAKLGEGFFTVGESSSAQHTRESSLMGERTLRFGEKTA